VSQSAQVHAAKKKKNKKKKKKKKKITRSNLQLETRPDKRARGAQRSTSAQASKVNPKESKEAESRALKQKYSNGAQCNFHQQGVPYLEQF
jgi:hypothetical protein